MHQLNCWRCGRKISATPEQIGLEFPCSGCGALYRVPSELFSGPSSSPQIMNNWLPGTIPDKLEPTFPVLTAAIVLSAISLLFNLASTEDSDAGFVLLTIVILLLSQCSWLLFHQRLWSLIPANQRTMSPAKAAWFLLIPFYNFYWMFKSCIPLQDGLNRQLDERGITALRASTGLAVGFSVLFLTASGLDFIAALAGGKEAAAAATLFGGGAEFVVWLLMVLNQKQVATQILLNPVVQPTSDSVIPQA